MPLVKYVPVLIASLMLGNWFMVEAKKVKAKQKPWYAAYATVPGILVVLAFIAAIVVKVFVV